MSGGGTVTTQWMQAEQEYEDEVTGMATMGRLFEASVSRNREQPAQQYKGGVYDRSLVSAGIVEKAPAGRYESLTYSELQQIVHTLAAGFRDLGVEPGERVAIFSDTRMEWAQVDFALLVAGAVVTTIYPESSPQQARFLLNDPGAVVVVVENEELLDRLLTVEEELELEHIVVMDDVTRNDREEIITLGELCQQGERISWPLKLESWLSSRSVDDLASIIYTSGTTGQPKGVKLTHRNFRANINQIRKRGGPRPDKPPELLSIDEDTTTLSFLPLAHVFERTVGHFQMFGAGGTIAYAESTDTVAEDLNLVKPDVLTSVPRVYERIYDSMHEQASESKIKKRVFNWALGVAREHSRREKHGAIHRLKHTIADRLVYNTINEELGANVEGFISGGGSLSKDLSELFDGMGLTIYEGYGLTETAPVVSVNPGEDTRPGTLGPPLVGVEVAIDESQVETSRRERASGMIGELLVRGPNVTEGYWNNPTATEDAFTDDGWFRTGDIVEVADDDYLIFHDRLKQVLVLSTGKNVAPGPIENAFATSDRVEQVMVIGDSQKYISALIVPNFDAVQNWAKQKRIQLPDSWAKMCHNEHVQQWVLEEVNEVNQRFQAEEQIKMFELVPDRWTPENDMLTPSLKKKRRNILSHYAGEVDSIYSNIEQQAGADD